ncbi:MAG: hypothetical protein GEV28_34480 [Actinophytocola sp.]|uniref:putative T7SS-secreted protein n=1 Tax=Actinophytocola sp. TaxID=1872138 RepID=UPI0013264C5E|nr:hypothetical protein [Actinophytocola sp.]MPZ85223.1 hypothetical protein [Actinophytocola sp.]
MTTDESEPFDRHNPIPGNAHAIQGEIDRVTGIRDRCHDTAGWLRQLSLDGWHGHAAEQFAAFKSSRLARQWEEVEDEHDLVATALADYRDILITLQPLARQAVERARQDGTWAQAEADIVRWREQAHTEAHKTAQMLREVAGRLRALPPLPDDDQAAAFSPNQPSSPRTRVDTTNNGVTPPSHTEPPARRQSPASLHEKVISLCDALLGADYVSEEDL